MSLSSVQTHLPDSDETEVIAKEIEARKLRDYLAASDPMSQAVIWLFLPGFFARLRALFRGKIVWLV